MRDSSFRRIFSVAFVAPIAAVLLTAGVFPAMKGSSAVHQPGSHGSRPSFITFESGPVRPMAFTPTGSHLIVTNIPDNRIEVFEVNEMGNLIYRGSIPVGLEPVAVAARANGEIWVVNHLSDSVSIVNLAERQVVRTLLVGDVTCPQERVHPLS